MCPEKFSPSCGTWRTIVTDRKKVFAQVRFGAAENSGLVQSLKKVPTSYKAYYYWNTYYITPLNHLNINIKL